MKKPYVAIVDDDAGFAQYLRTFLSLRGYEARCYTRGDELLASMKQGDVSNVLKTATGYQILKVETLTSVQTKPFAQAKADIDNKVYETKMQEETEKYLQKLRGQAIIEWKNPDLKKAYDAGLQARAKSPPPAPAPK